jgi:hypothetical protein
MKTSEVFKRTKQHLAKDWASAQTKDRFICLAISIAAAHSGRLTNKDVERCTEIVESRLQGLYTLESWLESRGCLNNYFLCDLGTKNRIQEHRHAWLDLLIAEFEAKGD